MIAKFLWQDARPKPLGIQVAFNQRLVSGDGQPEDLTDKGVYDPSLTAIREGKEECLGDFDIQREHVTFFGLGRTMELNFRFCLVRSEPIKSDELLSFAVAAGGKARGTKFYDICGL